ncbi:hypothetical protein [Streptomyces sp. NPDC002386]
MLFTTLDDVAAIVATRPTNKDTIPLSVDPAPARILPARNVAEGDVILAAVDKREGGYAVDWFCEAYEAEPKVFDPTCGCGVCELADPADGDHVVLTSESAAYGPWLACDPWPADRLVLVVPRFQPYPVGTRVEFSDGETTRRGRIKGIIDPCWPLPLRGNDELYPGGYAVGQYRVTPGYGHTIRPVD